MGVKVKTWKGAWWLSINHQRRRKMVRVGTGPTGKRAAEHAKIKIEARLAEGDHSVLDRMAPSMVPTLREYATQWLDKDAALRLKPITIERYRSTLEQQLFPAFGDCRLNDVTRTALKTQLAAWRTNGKVRGSGPLRPGSVKLLVAVLRTILNNAIEDGVLTANPAVRLGRFIRGEGMANSEDKAPDPFTAAELRHLLQTAEQEYPEWHTFFFTMARTGLRVGECLALQCDDLTLSAGVSAVIQ
jgi:integrase